MRKITSKFIKKSLFYYYRFIKGNIYLATECINYSDFVIVNSKSFTEIEIKIDKSDLKKDSLKPKHKVYETGKDSRKYTTPNYFYFCVPKELKEEALKVSEKLNNKYGVIVCYNDKNMGENLKIVKKAYKLHKNIPTQSLFIEIVKRMSSEIANLYLKIVR